MTDKEKADCLIELHREQIGKFKQTREIEFKVNLAFWSIIIVAGYYLNKDIVLCDSFAYIIFSIIYLVATIIIVYVHYSLWMKPIHKSEDVDDYYINEYRAKVENLTEISIEKCKDFDKDSQNWTKFEVGITAFLLVIVWIYIIL